MPDQQIVADRRKRSSRDVVIRPAKGAVVTLGELTLGSGDSGDGPEHLTIERMRTGFASRGVQQPVAALPGTRDVTLRGIDAGNFTLWGVRDVRVLGRRLGPVPHRSGHALLQREDRRRARPVPTSDVLVDGAKFHDYRFGPECWNQGSECHFECMYVNGSRNVTIRNSKFRDCALYDIFVTLSGPAAGERGPCRADHREQLVRHAMGRERAGHRPAPPRERAGAQLVPELAARLPRRADPLQLVPAGHRDPPRPQPGVPLRQRARRRQPARLGRLRHPLELRLQRLEHRPAPRPLRAHGPHRRRLVPVPQCHERPGLRLPPAQPSSWPRRCSF